MLFEFARVFDPLGFLAPATIKGKLLVQKLWKHQLMWDQEIPEELAYSYLKFRQQLSDIDELFINQKFCDHVNLDEIKLYGFSDTSDKAYSAVLYMRCSWKNDVRSYIVSAKTRVASLDKMTISKLELQSAQLLAELIVKIAPNLGVPLENVKCFSDSTIVLSWLNKSPTNLKTFVSNRV